MAEQEGRVLVVGDAQTLETIKALPALQGCQIEGCRGQFEALRRLRQSEHDVVVTSRWTSIDEDLAFLEDVHETSPGVRGILIVPSAERSDVIESVRAQVFALFTDPVDPEDLGLMIQRAIQERDWKEDIKLVSGLPHWITLRVTSRRITAERLILFMEAIENEVGLDEHRKLLAAFRELLLNAMEHGAGFGTGQTVDVSAVRTKRAIVFHFRDPGRGFQMDKLEHAAIANPEENPLQHIERRDALGLRPGGFGILIARQVADELYFNEAGNQVILIKYTP